MLPHVVRFNREMMAEAYPELELIASSHEEQKLDLADRLTAMLELAGLQTQLSACDVEKDALPRLAEAAAAQWTGTFNPRDVDAKSLLELYEAAY